MIEKKIYEPYLVNAESLYLSSLQMGRRIWKQKWKPKKEKEKEVLCIPNHNFASQWWYHVCKEAIKYTLCFCCPPNTDYEIITPGTICTTCKTSSVKNGTSACAGNQTRFFVCSPFQWLSSAFIKTNNMHSPF